MGSLLKGLIQAAVAKKKAAAPAVVAKPAPVTTPAPVVTPAPAPVAIAHEAPVPTPAYTSAPQVGPTPVKSGFSTIPVAPSTGGGIQTALDPTEMRKRLQGLLI